MQEICLQKSQIILEEVTDCFKNLRTFGTKVEDLPSINKKFLIALSGYDVDEIKKAFRVYSDENPNMPTTSCILRLLLDNRKHRCKMDANTAQIEKQRNPKYSELPDELKFEADNAFLEMKANLAINDAPKEISEPDYSHWEKESEANQRQAMRNLVEKTKILRGEDNEIME